MARCDFTCRRRRLAACSCACHQHVVAAEMHIEHTSVMPFLRWRLQRTVHAIRRGFLRCRKSDSDLPFWKRKILLSPRTKSLPCTEPHCQLGILLRQSRLKLYVSTEHYMPGPPRCTKAFVSCAIIATCLAVVFLHCPFLSFSAVGMRIAQTDLPYLARVNLLTGKGVVVRSHFSDV